MTIDFLDRLLLYISKQTYFEKTNAVIKEFTAEENKLIIKALYKLEKDGHIYPDKDNSRKFYISFDGLFALENSDGNRPYEGLKRRERHKRIWMMAKTIAAIANAIIIILIGYWAVQAQRGANIINNMPTKQDTIYIKCDTIIKGR